ncbi:MAG: hypothetical protein KJN76_11575 [Eudoraea sp.]|nr:hypothetical protein [Eudoraea sp.]
MFSCTNVMTHPALIHGILGETTKRASETTRAISEVIGKKWISAVMLSNVGLKAVIKKGFSLLLRLILELHINFQDLNCKNGDLKT